MTLATPAMSISGTDSLAALDAQARRISAAVATGDESAFRQLYDQYHRRLFRLALSLNQGDEATAHEIVQSTLLTAAAKLKPLHGEEHLWNWLAQVARRHSQKIWRKARRRPDHAPLSDLSCEPEITPAADSLEESLDVALLTLAADERQIVEWFYFDGVSHKEIAARLETTPKAVSGRLERARVKLRDQVAKRIDAT